MEKQEEKKTILVKDRRMWLKSRILFVLTALMEEFRSFVFHAGNIFWDKGDIIKNAD